MAVDPDFRHNHWVYLYYSPPGSTPVDDPATPSVNEGDAPVEGTGADWRRFRGNLRLSRFKLRGARLDLAPSRRSSTCRSTAACAATSAARSTSTPRATSTCRLATTRIRSSPTATTPSTSGRAEPGVRQPAQLGQHERPARQAAANPPEGGRRLQHPGRQPVPEGARSHSTGDLRDGPAQPVPVRGRPPPRRRPAGRLLA